MRPMSVLQEKKIEYRLRSEQRRPRSFKRLALSSRLRRREDSKSRLRLRRLNLSQQFESSASSSKSRKSWRKRERAF